MDYTILKLSRPIYFDPQQALRLVLGETKEISGSVFDGIMESEIMLKATAFKNFTDDNLYLRILLAVKRYLEGEPRKHFAI